MRTSVKIFFLTVLISLWAQKPPLHLEFCLSSFLFTLVVVCLFCLVSCTAFSYPFSNYLDSVNLCLISPVVFSSHDQLVCRYSPALLFFVKVSVILFFLAFWSPLPMCTFVYDRCVTGMPHSANWTQRIHCQHFGSRQYSTIPEVQFPYQSGKSFFFFLAVSLVLHSLGEVA